MPYNPSRELCFQPPLASVGEVLTDIEELGYDFTVKSSLEDLAEHEPLFHHAILALLRNKSVFDRADSTKIAALNTYLEEGVALAYFVMSYARPSSYVIQLDHAALVSLVVQAEHYQLSQQIKMVDFFTHQYARNSTLEQVFENVGLGLDDPRSTLAQVGAGAVTFFLDGQESIRRNAPYN